MPLDSKRDLELFDSALPWAAGVAPVLRLLPTRTACRRIFVENSAEYARHHRLAAMVFFSSQCGRPSLERPRCNLLVRSLLNCEPGRRTGAVQIGRGPADLGCDITSDALASGAEPSRYTAHISDFQRESLRNVMFNCKLAPAVLFMVPFHAPTS